MATRGPEYAAPRLNKCVECNDNTNCTADPAKGFCVKNACTGCQAAGAGACTGAKPMCATTVVPSADAWNAMTIAAARSEPNRLCDANQCRACKKDLECAGASQAGVCGLDGLVSGDDAVIYLQNSAALLDDQTGATAPPLRPPAMPTTRLASIATKSVIVVHGTVAPLGPLVLAMSSPAVLIAGNRRRPCDLRPEVRRRSSPYSRRRDPRDLTIQTGNDTGVSVSGGATLHMDRCYV